jgi:ribosome-binding protein aMBF1 (putative translation factor)
MTLPKHPFWLDGGYDRLQRASHRCIASLTMETMTDPNVLGALVRNRREAAGLTMLQLAEDADLGRSTVDRIENGKMEARPSNLARVLNVLGIRFDEVAELVTNPRRLSAAMGQTSPRCPQCGKPL